MRVGTSTASSSLRAVGALRQRWDQQFDTAVVTGSGFSFEPIGGVVVDSIPYASVSGMPTGSVIGHAHEFRQLLINGKHHLLCAGRFHLYEGLCATDCQVLVDIAHGLNCRQIVLMNAVGALSSRYAVGDVVMPTDLLDLTLTSAHRPVQGTASGAVWNTSRDQLAQRCREHGINVRGGTYVQVLGPSYETRAEVRMLSALGADIVGMSTAIEARRAHNLGLNCVIVSLVTNVHSQTASHTTTHDEVILAAKTAARQLSHIIELTVA
ncbi:MAG: purine-nucleoside phosphorylase [Candidatus Kapabacteria bacterium]|nr:purine-nucleoside phosphorylase [Candidatus Kapabacteria bacterium]